MRFSVFFCGRGHNVCEALLLMALRFANLQSPVLAQASSDPVVTLSTGAQVMGRIVNNLPLYLGIRYASAGRFEAPKLWTLPPGQIAKATVPGAWCVQFVPNVGIFGKEDCHYLNVITPSTRKSLAKRAVMVWIHGGALQVGASKMDPYPDEPYPHDHDAICNSTGKVPFQDLVQEGELIVVSFNYRLGLLGFFTPDDASAPKNFGFRDQIVALQWVKTNIESFGGDPGSVTIFGQSAGGLSVMALYHSPLAVDLFHRAICQSPGTVAPGQIQKPWKDAATSMSATCMQANGCDTVDCLRSIPLEALFWTCIDWFLLLHEFLTKPGFIFAGYDGEVVPHSLYEKGCAREPAPTSRERPLLVGTVAHEWREFDQLNLPPTYAYDATKILDVYLSEYVVGYAGANAEVKGCAHKKLRSFYASVEDPMCVLCDKLKMPADLIEIASDFIFDVGARIFTAEHGGPRYRYVFDMGDGFTPWGTTHESELSYIQSCVPSMLRSAVIDEDFGRALREYWISFAKTGKPTSRTGPAWERVNEDSGLLGLPMMQIAMHRRSMTTSAWHNNETAALLTNIACKHLELESTINGSSCAFKQRLGASSLTESANSQIPLNDVQISSSLLMFMTFAIVATIALFMVSLHVGCPIHFKKGSDPEDLGFHLLQAQCLVDDLRW